MAHRILVVDDERAIRNILQHFLVSLDYEVDIAKDGMEALEILSKASYDLVLSDINMPRMKGFELLKIVREKYPQTKRALITAYNVDDYLKLAMDHDVGNIIPKATPFNFEDVKMVVHNLITEEFFDLERYVETEENVRKTLVTNPNQIDEVAKKFSSFVADPDKKEKYKLVMMELLTNAVFYGARSESGADKDKWGRDFELSPDKAIEACWAQDEEKFGFSVVDKGGRLKKKDVLHWLNRQVNKDEQGLPIGIFDIQGRGFFIAREYADSLIINVKAGFRTEIIILSYYDRKVVGHKPLYINEV